LAKKTRRGGRLRHLVRERDQGVKAARNVHPGDLRPRKSGSQDKNAQKGKLGAWAAEERPGSLWGKPIREGGKAIKRKTRGRAQKGARKAVGQRRDLF